jgi:hypothetical protein
MSNTNEVQDVPAPKQVSRGGRRALIAGGCVVALGVVAIGGAVIGRNTTPQQPVSAAVIEPANEPGNVPMGMSNGSAPEASDTKVASSSMIWPGVNTVFTAGKGLPKKPGTASGYTVDDTGIDRAALARELASVFGVAGEPVKNDYGWSVGPTDGSSPSIYVNEDSSASWSYNNPAAYGVPIPMAEGSAAARPPAESGAVEGSTGQPVPVAGSVEGSTGPTPAVSPAPSKKDAKEWATDIFTRLGVPLDQVDWQFDSYDPFTTATAWLTIDGERTQLQWSIGFFGEGEISSAYGFSAGLVEIPGYAIIGVKDAIARLNQPGWSALQPAMIYNGDVQIAADEQPAGQATMPPNPAYRGRPALGVTITVATITSSELGLAQYWQPDGTILMLPAYLISDKDGHQWSMLAVDDAYVAFTQVPPNDGPMPMARQGTLG